MDSIDMSATPSPFPLDDGLERAVEGARGREDVFSSVAEVGWVGSWVEARMLKR